MSKVFEAWKVGDKEFRLKLSIGEIERLERIYGMGNLLNPMVSAGEGQLPSTVYLLDVLHASFQKFNHGITRNEVVEIYEDWVDNHDGNMTDLMKVIMEVFKVSGFFPKEALGKAKEKE